jgi:hypothetical protein
VRGQPSRSLSKLAPHVLPTPPKAVSRLDYVITKLPGHVQSKVSSRATQIAAPFRNHFRIISSSLSTYRNEVCRRRRSYFSNLEYKRGFSPTTPPPRYLPTSYPPTVHGLSLSLSLSFSLSLSLIIILQSPLDFLGENGRATSQRRPKCQELSHLYVCPGPVISALVRFHSGLAFPNTC